jgi:hypothetical protein
MIDREVGLTIEHQPDDSNEYPIFQAERKELPCGRVFTSPDWS